MPDKLSELLEQQHTAQQLPAPPPYRRRLSTQQLLVRWSTIILLLAVCAVAAVYFAGFRWWYVLFVFPLIYAIYRSNPGYWRWRKNHISCDPKDGILRVEDHGHPFVLFFINGGTDDQIPLENIQLDTPSRSFLDRWVFHCDTLIAGDRVIKGVKDVAALQAIKSYREELSNHSMALSGQQVNIQLALLKTMEGLASDVHELLDLAKKHVSVVATPQVMYVPYVQQPPPELPGDPGV